ncbi:hypothetical protein U1707_14295 [Sphingomonas sp. PB2P12]
MNVASSMSTGVTSRSVDVAPIGAGSLPSSAAVLVSAKPSIVSVQ